MNHILLLHFIFLGTVKKNSTSLQRKSKDQIKQEGYTNELSGPVPHISNDLYPKKLLNRKINIDDTNREELIYGPATALLQGEIIIIQPKGTKFE